MALTDRPPHSSLSASQLRPAAALEFGTNARTPALSRDGAVGASCDWVMEAASTHGELAMGSQQQAAQLEKHSKSTRSSLAAGV